MTELNKTLIALRELLSNPKLSEDDWCVLRPHLAEHGEGDADYQRRYFGAFLSKLKGRSGPCWRAPLMVCSMYGLEARWERASKGWVPVQFLRINPLIPPRGEEVRCWVVNLSGMEQVMDTPKALGRAADFLMKISVHGREANE